jgi:hypothetical protein
MRHKPKEIRLVHGDEAGTICLLSLKGMAYEFTRFNQQFNRR